MTDRWFYEEYFFRVGWMHYPELHLLRYYQHKLGMIHE